MKNYEKYADEIKRYSDSQVLCDEIKIPFILEPTGKSCTRDIDCDTCQTLTTLWLLEEYEEPETDWNKVEVDTPILVTNFEDSKWRRRYFAKFEDGKVYAWVDGGTSWSSDNKTHKWNYAKLAEDEKECKDLEIDWSEVEIDTPILVKDYEDAKWSKRHFAKYENGIIYAWQAGCTSQSIAVHMSKWKYAKLAENEETK